MKITYKTVKFTAKYGSKQVRGTFTPNGSREHFFCFLSNTAKKLVGSKDVIFDGEKMYDWGSTIWATANDKKFVIFIQSQRLA